MEIEYYKTYTITYKFPPLKFVYIEDAWPSVNDDCAVDDVWIYPEPPPF